MVLIVFCLLLGRLVACYDGLMSAKSALELVDQEVQMNRQVQLLAGCQRELAAEQFPRSCLAYLNLLEGSQATQISVAWFDRINQACQARLTELQDIQEVQLLAQQAVFGVCKRALVRHQEDLFYIQKSGTSFVIPTQHEEVQSPSQPL